MAGPTPQETEMNALFGALERERSNLVRAKESASREEITETLEKIASYEGQITALLESDTSKDATDDFKVPASPTAQQHSLSPPNDYWPSTNPSPFTVNAANHGDAPSIPLASQAPLAESSGESSRKRPREGSVGESLTHAPKKTTSTHPMNQSTHPMNQLHRDLDAQLEERLENNRQIYASMRDPAEVEKNAKLEGLSVEEYLEENALDEEESEKAIRLDIQIEKDQDFARMLQHRDDEQDNSGFDLPYRSQPDPPTPPTQPSRQQQSSPAPQAQDLDFETDSDDDIQEIPRTLFPSSGEPSSSNNRPRHPIFGISNLRLRAVEVNKRRSEMGKMFQKGHDEWIGAGNDGADFLATREFQEEDDILVEEQNRLKRLGFDGDLHLEQTARARALSFMPPRLDPRTDPRMYPGMYSRTDPRLYHSLDSAAIAIERQRLEEEDIDFEEYEDKNFPEDIKKLLTGIKDINSATQADDEETPSSLRVTLMKHQKIGLKWLKAKELSSHKGGILADDMGLGKTIQAIALMAAHPSEPGHPTLIVAPKALLGQWKSEIVRHINPGSSQLSVFTFHNLPGIATNPPPWRELRKYDVVITTFATLSSNFNHWDRADSLEKENKNPHLAHTWRKRAVLYGSAKWHRVILDEAQGIKNASTKSAKACYALNATYRWCLTGTPMMNRLEDFQSLLRFLNIRPYSNIRKFKMDFGPLIKATGYSEDLMAQLRVLVKSVCLRRTKQTKIDGKPILDLPPKTIEKVHVLFSPEEKKFYDELESNSQKQVDRLVQAGTLGKNYSHVFVLLLRLRQACDHPLLINALSSEGTTSSGVNPAANVKLLAAAAVNRLLSEEISGGLCSICMDAAETPVIYTPCGHFSCAECFTRMSEADENQLKCQNCRGPVDSSKVTDVASFKRVHDPSSLPEEERHLKVPSEGHDDDSDLESADEDGTTPKKKKQSLAELRIEGTRNKAKKRKYLRRLDKMWSHSAKTLKTMEILQQNQERGQGEKTIIFSLFTSLLDLLEVPIFRKGWKYTRFDGTSSVDERTEAIDTFTNDPDCNIMLISIKAGNAGLNLVAASHVIIFDPFWNPYVEDQAIDRAHRIGQLKEVFVHRLLIEGTVEDRVLALQEQKRELISGALDEGGAMNVAGLSMTDLLGLFGGRRR